VKNLVLRESRFRAYSLLCQTSTELLLRPPGFADFLKEPAMHGFT